MGYHLVISKIYGSQHARYAIRWCYCTKYIFSLWYVYKLLKIITKICLNVQLTNKEKNIYQI